MINKKGQVVHGLISGCGGALASSTVLPKVVLDTVRCVRGHVGLVAKGLWPHCKTGRVALSSGKYCSRIRTILTLWLVPLFSKYRSRSWTKNISPLHYPCVVERRFSRWGGISIQFERYIEDVHSIHSLTAGFASCTPVVTLHVLTKKCS